VSSINITWQEKNDIKSKTNYPLLYYLDHSPLGFLEYSGK